MREILIFVAGATPQIITETIYALSQQSPPLHPDELYIITTKTGKQRIKDTLIQGNILGQLVEEYALPPIHLEEDSFIVIKGADGAELEDIRTEEDNGAAGDLIASIVQDKARDADARLHCSLTGGRKTLSFYLGSALQLFGRPWDKLYHLLVTAEFEANPEFYYKPGHNETIQCRLSDGSTKKLNTDEAGIELAELPFIRVGHIMPMLGRRFSDLIQQGQREIDTATTQQPLMINLRGRTIYIGETLIEIVPIHMMIYAAFLNQKMKYCKHPDRRYCLECTDCFQALADMSSRPAIEEMAKDYDTIYSGQAFKRTELLSKWPEGMKVEILRQNITKINKEFKERIESIMLPFYSISTIKKYGSSRYGVRVEKGKIYKED